MRTKRLIINIAITLGVLILAFLASIVLQGVMNVEEHITTVFVFAVFIISIFTDGYIYGIVTAVFSVFAINSVFTFPYFAFNFTIPENFLSALIMTVISVMTSALTTKLKTWEKVKAESENETMRANLLRAISHDLRTPLTTIYGASSTVLDSYEQLSDEQKRKLISGIKEDSGWLTRIVENLLSVTRIDEGKVKLIMTPTVLDELIDSVLIKFKKRYPDMHISLSLPDSVIVIPMDAVLVEQVLINLLDNAVRHATGMTSLSLSVSAEGGEARFEVSDDGCGIPEERLRALISGDKSIGFSPDNAGRNAGIGLSVCATIIRAHGGLITAKNKSEGGATFSFTLKTEEAPYEQ